MDQKTIVIIVISILIVLFLAQMMEKLDNTTNIQGIGNPYTGLFCYNDNNPIVSFVNGTFTANSYDGVTPLYRNDYKIPNDFVVDPNYTGKPGQSPFLQRKINCNMIDIPHFYDPNKLDSNGKKIPDNRAGPQILPNDPVIVNTLSRFPNVDSKMLTTNIISNSTDLNNNHINGFLSSDGIRQLATNNPNNENSRDIFNKLSKSGQQINCTYENFNDPNHWCNKTFNNFSTICSNPENILGSGTGCAGFNTIKSFATTKPITILAKTSTLTPTILSGPSANDIAKCSMNCTRNPSTRSGTALTICKSNCSTCGKTPC
jgi:hypothetical protein